MAAETDASTIGPATRRPASLSPAMETDAEKLRFIEEMTRNVDAVQERVLAEILGRNAESEYLTNCCLAGAIDRATFRVKVPVVSYEDLQPYIRRIAEGDRSPILSGSKHPIFEFLTSSGTSGGERKLLPTVEDELDRRKLMSSLAMPVINQYIPGLDEGSALCFFFAKSETMTPGGLPARPTLTSYYKSDHFKNCTDGRYKICTSPLGAILCEDAFQSMYAQMLCGLCHRNDVVRLCTVFASTLVRAIYFLQQNWEPLATDIETGVLNHRVTDTSVRKEVGDILGADLELARCIRTECSKEDWAGIITRIWPNTKYLETIVTGSMAQYIPTLNYYSGGLPMASIAYASSECYFGLNLRPFCDPSEVSYAIMPNMAYFEFIPTDGNGDTSQLVDLARVEVGREYELVITNHSGLNRYRVGDILRVTGFHNMAPQFSFVRRRNVLLSVESDKTDEAELQRAVERASSLLCTFDAAVLDYTSQACTKSIPGHYVIYWELLLTKGSDTMIDDETLQKCCLEMEEALNAVYRQSRVADASIGPLEIRIVKAGTFEKLMDYAISRGTSIAQYKVPRCVTLPAVIEMLDSHVTSCHFSPKLPHWAPGQQLDSTDEK